MDPDDEYQATVMPSSRRDTREARDASAQHDEPSVELRKRSEFLQGALTSLSAIHKIFSSYEAHGSRSSANGTHCSQRQRRSSSERANDVRHKEKALRRKQRDMKRMHECFSASVSPRASPRHGERGGLLFPVGKAAATPSHAGGDSSALCSVSGNSTITTSSSDSDEEASKTSRWARATDAPEEDDDDDSADNPALVQLQRRIIAEAIDARRDELDAVGSLLTEFHQEQVEVSSQLSELQSERYQEVQQIGRLIADLARRRDSELQLYDLELRMKMADLPLTLQHPPKVLRDASVDVREDDLLREAASSIETHAGSRTELVSVNPYGGGLLMPPKPSYVGLSAEFYRKLHEYAMHCAVTNGSSTTASAAAAAAASAASAAATPVVVTGGVSSGSSNASSDLLFLLRIVFAEQLLDECWRRDPVGYVTSTTVFLQHLAAVCTKHNGYLNTATRHHALVVFADPGCAFECFCDLDQRLMSSRWDQSVRLADGCATITVTPAGDISVQQQPPPAARGSRDDNGTTVLFRGPRVAGALMVSRLAQASKGRLRCDYNPAEQRYEYLGFDVDLVEQVATQLARGGELLMPREVWQCVVHAGTSTHAHGAVLYETAYRFTAAELNQKKRRFGCLLDAALIQVPEGVDLRESLRVALDHDVFYAKFVAPFPFELRARGAFLGAPQRCLAQRELTQPTVRGGPLCRPFVAVDVPWACEVSDGAWIREVRDLSAIALYRRASRRSSSMVARKQEPAVDSLTLSINELLPTLYETPVAGSVLHVTPFRRPLDQAWSGILTVTVPDLAGMLSVPGWDTSLEILRKAAWIASAQVVGRYSGGGGGGGGGGGRMHINHFLHSAAASSPLLSVIITTDPAEAKAMIASVNINEVVVFFRDPVDAAHAALLLQARLAEVTIWPQAILDWYSVRDDTAALEVHGASAMGGSSSPSSATMRWPLVQRRSKSAATASQVSGLRVAIGVTSGIPTMVTDPSTKLLSYSGACMEYSRTLARHARPGEILVSHFERDRLVSDSGALAPLGTFLHHYHFVSVAPPRYPDHLRVHALVSSAFRDRQSLFGELPIASLNAINDALAAVRAEMSLARRDSLSPRNFAFAVAATGSVPTSPKHMLIGQPSPLAARSRRASEKHVVLSTAGADEGTPVAPSSVPSPVLRQGTESLLKDEVVPSTPPLSKAEKNTADDGGTVRRDVVGDADQQPAIPTPTSTVATLPPITPAATERSTTAVPTSSPVPQTPLALPPVGIRHRRPESGLQRIDRSQRHPDLLTEPTAEVTIESIQDAPPLVEPLDTARGVAQLAAQEAKDRITVSTMGSPKRVVTSVSVSSSAVVPTTSREAQTRSPEEVNGGQDVNASRTAAPALIMVDASTEVLGLRRSTSDERVDAGVQAANAVALVCHSSQSTPVLASPAQRSPHGTDVRTNEETVGSVRRPPPDDDVVPISMFVEMSALLKKVNSERDALLADLNETREKLRSALKAERRGSSKTTVQPLRQMDTSTQMSPRSDGLELAITHTDNLPPAIRRTSSLQTATNGCTGVVQSTQTDLVDQPPTPRPKREKAGSVLQATSPEGATTVSGVESMTSLVDTERRPSMKDSSPTSVEPIVVGGTDGSPPEATAAAAALCSIAVLIQRASEPIVSRPLAPVTDGHAETTSRSPQRANGEGMPQHKSQVLRSMSPRAKKDVTNSKSKAEGDDSGSSPQRSRKALMQKEPKDDYRPSDTAAPAPPDGRRPGPREARAAAFLGEAPIGTRKIRHTEDGPPRGQQTVQPAGASSDLNALPGSVVQHSVSPQAPSVAPQKGARGAMAKRPPATEWILDNLNRTESPVERPPASSITHEILSPAELPGATLDVALPSHTVTSGTSRFATAPSDAVPMLPMHSLSPGELRHIRNTFTAYCEDVVFSPLRAAAYAHGSELGRDIAIPLPGPVIPAKHTVTTGGGHSTALGPVAPSSSPPHPPTVSGGAQFSSSSSSRPWLAELNDRLRRHVDEVARGIR